MILKLPEELVLAVCEHLSAPDLLLLKQTCRGLHESVSADYLWRRLSFDMPIDLPVHRNEVPGRQIQQSAVRALRLEKNWRRKASDTRRLTRIPHVATVIQLQFLGPSFIAIVSLAVRFGAFVPQLSIWHVGTSYDPYPPSEVLSIEVPSNSKFTAAHSNGQVVIALTAGDSRVKSLLKVLTAPLHEDNVNFDTAPVLKEIFSETRPLYGEIFFDVHISGSKVVAGLAKLANDVTNPSTYQVLLIDIQTGFRAYMGIPVQGLGHVRLKLYDEALFIIGVQDGTSVSISTHTLPQDLGSIGDGEELAPIARYRTKTLPLSFEYYISSEPTNHVGPLLSLFLFHESSSPLNPKGLVTAFSIPVQKTPGNTSDGPYVLDPLYSFETTAGSSPDIMCPGESGRRLVWLERRWDTEEAEYQFMKASFKESDSEGVSVAPIWPNYVALPFQPHTCRSMCFEECTGRICFALCTEEIYLVEF